MQRRFLSVSRAILLIGILLSVGIVSAVVGMKIAVQQTEVETPEILGRSFEEANELLSATELNMTVLARRYDADSEEGQIISQSPAAGGRIKTGHKVRVVVSLGPRLNPVPSLVGGTLRIARARLLQTEYELGTISEVLVEDGPEEEVLHQYPAAGSQESGGTRVDLLVARRAPLRFIMPEIVGEKLSRVYVFFERQGFRMGGIQYRQVSGRSRGTVLRQYPEPGSLLREDDEINVEVAG